MAQGMAAQQSSPGLAYIWDSSLCTHTCIQHLGWLQATSSTGKFSSYTFYCLK